MLAFWRSFFCKILYIEVTRFLWRSFTENPSIKKSKQTQERIFNPVALALPLAYLMSSTCTATSYQFLYFLYFWGTHSSEAKCAKACVNLDALKLAIFYPRNHKIEVWLLLSSLWHLHFIPQTIKREVRKMVWPNTINLFVKPMTPPNKTEINLITNLKNYQLL